MDTPLMIEYRERIKGELEKEIKKNLVREPWFNSEWMTLFVCLTSVIVSFWVEYVFVLGISALLYLGWYKTLENRLKMKELSLPKSRKKKEEQVVHDVED